MNTTNHEQDFNDAVDDLVANGGCDADDLPTLQELMQAIKDTVDDEPLKFPTFEDFFSWWDVTTAFDQLDTEQCAERHKPALKVAYDALVSESFF